MKAFWLAFLLLVAACHSTSENPELKEAVTPAVQVEKDDARGYFVSIAADARSQTAVMFYDRLYDALHTYNRKKATAAGKLDDYLGSYEAADGYTNLSVGDNEIECDRKKCLLRLTSRHLAGSGDDGRFAGELTIALAEAKIKPVVNGSGLAIEKTYTLGDKNALHIICKQQGVPNDNKKNSAQYQCDFDLDKGLAEAASDSVTMMQMARGKLSNCSSSPGTVKTAQEALEQTDHSILLKLTSGAGAGSYEVGYVHAIQQTNGIELLSLYLCGDLSYDTFAINGPAREIKNWVSTTLKAGDEVGSLPSIQQGDADMQLATKLVGVNADELNLRARFKLIRSAAKDPMHTADVDGEDQFYVRLPKAWLKIGSRDQKKDAKL